MRLHQLNHIHVFMDSSSSITYRNIEGIHCEWPAVSLLTHFLFLTLTRTHLLLFSRQPVFLLLLIHVSVYNLIPFLPIFIISSAHPSPQFFPFPLTHWIWHPFLSNRAHSTPSVAHSPTPYTHFPYGYPNTPSQNSELHTHSTPSAPPIHSPPSAHPHIQPLKPLPPTHPPLQRTLSPLPLLARPLQTSVAAIFVV